MNKMMTLIGWFCFMVILAGCGSGAEEQETDVDFEVMDRSRSVSAENFQNGAELIHDEDMLMTSLEETGADIDAEDMDFEEELLFEVSIMENGCGFTLVSIDDKDGVLEFMFELTPVAAGEADADDIACTEIAVPAVFYVKTDPIEFHNLEVYGSGMKYE